MKVISVPLLKEEDKDEELEPTPSDEEGGIANPVAARSSCSRLRRLLTSA